MILININFKRIILKMIFRSEAMSYFDVILPVENSWSFVE